MRCCTVRGYGGVVKVSKAPKGYIRPIRLEFESLRLIGISVRQAWKLADALNQMCGEIMEDE